MGNDHFPAGLLSMQIKKHTYKSFPFKIVLTFCAAIHIWSRTITKSPRVPLILLVATFE